MDQNQTNTTLAPTEEGDQRIARPLRVLATGIPAELTAAPAWCVWRSETRDGKPTKVPVAPDGRAFRSNDPTTWAPFKAAMAAHARGGFAGIGRAIDGDLVGVDIDWRHCDPPMPPAWLGRVLGLLDSWSETSPSGLGCHVWIRGEWNGAARQTRFPDGAVVEVYDAKSPRYFTVTGQTMLTSPGTIRSGPDAQAALEALAEELTKVAAPRKANGRADVHEDELPSAGEGQRRAILTSEAGRLRALGVTMAEARAILRACAAGCTPPVPEEHTEQILGWAWSKPAGEPRRCPVCSSPEPCSDHPVTPPQGTRPKPAEEPVSRSEAGPGLEAAGRGGDETSRKPHKTEVSVPGPPLALSKYTPFPVAVLPEPVRSYVQDGARTLGCDPAYVALPLLAALASAVGNTVRLALRTRGWNEPAIIWTALVGESGTLKSPAVELGVRPVRKRQHEAMKAHAEAIRRFEQDEAEYDRKLSQWKRSKDSVPPPTRPEKPSADRCWTDDVTIEALSELLVKNPRGLLVARDELAGWLDFDRYQGNGGDVARWLECFGGRSLIVDRKSSGTVYVPRAAVSLTGGIQPGVLSRALGTENRENGLLARLLLACPPRHPKAWRDIDLDERTTDAVAGVFDKLYRLTPETDADGNEQPRLAHLDASARETWVSFYNAHAEEQADLSGDLAAAWSKLEGYAARLALVLHLAGGTEGALHSVGPDSMEAGITLARWFGAEAARVYGIFAEDSERRESRLLMEWVAGRPGQQVTERDLTHGPRRYRGNPDAAEAGLNALVKAGVATWVLLDPGPAGGRPTRVCRLLQGGPGTETSKFPKNREVSSPGLSAEAPDGAPGALAVVPVRETL